MTVREDNWDNWITGVRFYPVNLILLLGGGGGPVTSLLGEIEIEYDFQYWLGAYWEVVSLEDFIVNVSKFDI